MDYRYGSTRPVNYSTQYDRNEPLGYTSHSTPYHQTSSYQTIETATNPTRRQLFSDRPKADTSSGLRGSSSRSTYKNPTPSYLNVGQTESYLSQTQRPLGSSKPNSSGETTSRLYDTRTGASTSARDTRRTSFSDSHRSFAKNPERRNEINPAQRQTAASTSARDNRRTSFSDSHRSFAQNPERRNETNPVQYQFTPSTRSHPSGYTASTSNSRASRRAQPPLQNTRTYERELQNFDVSNQPPSQHRDMSSSHTTNRKSTGTSSNTKTTDRMSRTTKPNASGRPMSSQPAGRKQSIHAKRNMDLVTTKDRRENAKVTKQIPTHRRGPETKPPRGPSSSTRPPRVSSGGTKRPAWGSAKTTANEPQSPRRAAATGTAAGKAQQAPPHPETENSWKNSAPNTRDMPPMDALKAIFDCELFASVGQVRVWMLDCPTIEG